MPAFWDEVRTAVRFFHREVPRLAALFLHRLFQIRALAAQPPPILSPARLPSAWYWADVGLTWISGVLPWSTMARGVGSHCGHIGLTWATCAEELQKTPKLARWSPALAIRESCVTRATLYQ